MAKLRRQRSRKAFKRAKKSRLGLWTALGVALLVVVYIGVLELSRPHVSGDRLRFDTFIGLAGKGQISNAHILDEDAYVVGTYIASDTPPGGVEAEDAAAFGSKGADDHVEPAESAPVSEEAGADVIEGDLRRYNAPLIRGTQGQVLEVLLRRNIPITIDQQVGKRVASLASMLLPGLILVVLFVYLILSYRRGTGLFGIRSGAHRVTVKADAATFAEVAGQDPAVTELREVKEFLADPERFTDLGAQVPKGILLFGPPGCGKTLLARALAGEAGASFYSISGSDFVELYVGVGAARVRDLFKEARENVPALIFIDELDSIGRARGSMATASSHGEQEQALNQILAEMDGFSAGKGVIVVAATNRPDVLDPALLRPGRFDRTIGLERPDEAGRLAILEIHAKEKKLEPGTDLAAIAHKAIGFTGADLASIINEGALLAARARKSAVSQVELDQALQRILEAPERQRRLSLKQRSIAKRFSSEQRMSFADVAGVDDAIAELAEVKDYLADPDRFAAMGARVPRGILLSGPPGCGKTLLARAVAGEANAAFFSVAGSEFVEVFVGEGASRVRELFAEARSVAPAIVFIDEMDAIGAQRSSGLDGNREAAQTLNQILVELDGFEARSGVIVMGATNRLDILDPALVRPGRFDRQITISPPDRDGRAAILGLHAAGRPLATDVDLDVVAGLTRGFSGADLANVVNEAALLATRRGLTEIPMELVEEGIDRAVIGVASRGTLMSTEEQRIVAYHEAGHALVTLAVPGTQLPRKLSVVPRGQSLGHCTVIDEVDRLIASEEMLMDQMAALLGGRAAEELVLGTRASSAAADLQRVSEIARHMVCQLGMSDSLGPMDYGNGGASRGSFRGHSEEAARTIDAESRRLVDEAYHRARSILNASREALDRVAEALLDREALTAHEIELLIAPPGAPDISLLKATPAGHG